MHGTFDIQNALLKIHCGFMYVFISTGMYLVVVYFVFRCSFYFFLAHVNSAKSYEWNCRIVAMVHAFISTRLTETCLIIGPWPFDTLGEVNTLMQTYVLNVSAGYFIFEILWCFYMRTEGFIML